MSCSTGRGSNGSNQGAFKVDIRTEVWGGVHWSASKKWCHHCVMALFSGIFFICKSLQITVQDIIIVYLYLFCTWDLDTEISGLNVCMLINIMAGWFTWDVVYGSSAIESRSASFSSTTIGVWYWQGYITKAILDDGCGSSDKPGKPNDCNACTTNIWASLSDIASSTEPAYNEWCRDDQCKTSHACHQLHADDL